MIQGTFTLRDLRDANWSHLRPRRALAVVGVLLVAAFCWALWYAFFGAWSASVGWMRWVMLAAAIYLVAFFAFGIPYRVQRTYRQRKDLQRPCAFVPSDAGLGVETQDAQGPSAALCIRAFGRRAWGGNARRARRQAMERLPEVEGRKVGFPPVHVRSHVPGHSEALLLVAGGTGLVSGSRAGKSSTP
jgi:hypothetical protein